MNTIKRLENGNIEVDGVVYFPLVQDEAMESELESPYITAVGEVENYYVNVVGVVGRSSYVRKEDASAFNALRTKEYAEKIAFQQMVRRKFDDFIHRNGLVPDGNDVRGIYLRSNGQMGHVSTQFCGGLNFANSREVQEDNENFDLIMAYMGDDLKRFFEWEVRG